LNLLRNSRLGAPERPNDRYDTVVAPSEVRAARLPVRAVPPRILLNAMQNGNRVRVLLLYGIRILLPATLRRLSVPSKHERIRSKDPSG
jgi:hypothetical protein